MTASLATRIPVAAAFGLAAIGLVFATAIGLVVGSAAAVGSTSGSLGAASISTPRCTNTALSVIPILTGSAVSSVSVGALPVACGGATLRVTVDNGTAAGSGSTTVPAGGGTVTVAISGAPVLDANVEIDAILEGP